MPEAIEIWLNICEKVGRDGREPVEQMTLVEYERRAKIMNQYAWSEPANELSASDIVHFRSWLLENHSRDLATRTLSSFGSVLKEMAIPGYIASNPATGISIRSDGRYETYSAEIAIPSDREVQAILETTQALKSKSKLFEKAWRRYRPMILLIVFAGLRMSEARGISWSSVHRDRIDIRQRADKLGIIGPVKSRSAYRTIELSSKVTDELFSWREHCPRTTSDLVFPTKTGRPIMLNNFYLDAWRPLMRHAGLMIRDADGGNQKAAYAPHALRHYYASKLIEMGKDIKFIQTRMGHSNSQITLDVYGHLMKDREAEHQATADEFASELL